MKDSARGKIILMHFLRWIRDHAAAIVTVSGLILLFGSAGSMDYAATTGAADSGLTFIMAVMGAAFTCIGFLSVEGFRYGKGKDL